MHLSILAVLVCTLAARQELSAQFTGTFADGTRFQGAQLIDWPVGKGPPRLKESAPGDTGHDLGPVFDAKNPVTWLYQERIEASVVQQPYVEFFGGDRLPGLVIGYRYGTETPVERLPPHLLVKLDFDSAQSPQAIVRVRAQAVRKVVWQPRRDEHYNPATLYLQDDRKVGFRALRWTAEGVTLVLPEGGIRSVPISEIAEVHLPRRDPWRAYQETLAFLTPDCSARLLRIETSRGLVLTGVLDRSRADARWHLLQPAWCLEPIGFSYGQLRWLRFFWPHEVPLSIIEPVRTGQRSPLEGMRAWQADRNVKLRPLRSGGQLYGDGFGMQSESELEFALPDGVRGFHARVGMDELAARGGCGRGRIHVNSLTEKPLWQSKVLVGSGEMESTGDVPLQGPAQGQKTLILVAEAPTVDRPPDADPLNIRSFVDWLEPRVDLDPSVLRTAVQRLLPETIPAWQGWTVSTGDSLELRHRWEAHDPADPHFRRDVIVQRGSLLLSREVELGPNQNYLCLSLSQEPGSPAGAVEVRVDGQLVAQLTVPEPERGEGDAAGRWFYPAPRCVPLAKYRGRNVPIEVKYEAAAGGGAVEWRGLELVPTPELVPWTPVKVAEARAAAPETRLVQEPDNTLFAGMGKQRVGPRTDRYTIVADTDLSEISAFRLELLPDARLPNNGPGRSKDGQVFLSEFKVTAAPRDRPEQAEPVTLTAAGTDYLGDNSPSAAVDGKPDTGWHPVPSGRAHVIVFTAAQNIAYPGGARLSFTLDQNLNAKHLGAARSPGRFRLLVTGAARPIPVARPGVVLKPPNEKK